MQRAGLAVKRGQRGSERKKAREKSTVIFAVSENNGRLRLFITWCQKTNSFCQKYLCGTETGLKQVPLLITNVLMWVTTAKPSCSLLWIAQTASLTENTEPANRSSCEGAGKCCASPTEELVIEIAVVKCQHNKANAFALDNSSQELLKSRSNQYLFQMEWRHFLFQQ